MSHFDTRAIRARLPIQAVLADHGRLLRRGRGPCPLCLTSPRSTAFSVRDEHFRCFACQEHGDVIDLVQKLEKLPVGEAIRLCAALAGLSPGHNAPADIVRRSAPFKPRERADDWWRYIAVKRCRQAHARLYEEAATTMGADHPVTDRLGRRLAMLLNAEQQAEAKLYQGEEVF